MSSILWEDSPARGPIPGKASVRGEWLLRRLEKPFVRLDMAIGRAMPESLNPFAWAGAIANTCFFVALVTGVLLLFYYTPSVHSAYRSVENMAASPWTAHLMRSLHRYSSDGCMFFVIFHALQTFFSRKFGGPRWLAWTTGIVLISSLWFVGWLGYWLVWDERAHQVALGTAQLLDSLPIFIDPLSRAFLTDEGVNSLLFFIIFFFHMLIPLGMGIALWLHINRLSRPRFLTKGPITWWVLGSLLVLSILSPAGSAAPAKMMVHPQGFTMDWWYLMPFYLTDRLSGGALWALLLIGGTMVISVPWWMTRGKREIAVVDISRCIACRTCYDDCPYNAIEMTPRSDDKKHPSQAEIIPARCVGCGICVGSCPSLAISMPGLNAEKLVGRWLDEERPDGEPFYLALLCEDSAGAGLVSDALKGTCPDLPGYHALEAPCGGWINMRMIEDLLERGVDGLLVAACHPEGCEYRTGADLTEQRFAGEHVLKLNDQWRNSGHIRLEHMHRNERKQLIKAAREFREGAGPSTPKRRRLPLASGILVAAIITAIVWLASDMAYKSPDLTQPMLVVSFKHPGQIIDMGGKLSEEELQKLPRHMRPQNAVTDRKRVPVRMKVYVDGKIHVERSYPPKGIWSDGNSVAIERLPVGEGLHKVRVEISDSVQSNEWNWIWERELQFENHSSRVVLFEKVGGFTWY